MTLGIYLSIPKHRKPSSRSLCNFADYLDYLLRHLEEGKMARRQTDDVFIAAIPYEVCLVLDSQRYIVLAQYVCLRDVDFLVDKLREAVVVPKAMGLDDARPYLIDLLCREIIVQDRLCSVK